MNQHTAHVAEQLRVAFDSNDLAGIASLLHDNVRWGGEEDTEQTCHNRGDVLAWYGKLSTAGVQAVVAETLVQDDSIVLGLTMTWPANLTEEEPRPDRVYQVFHLADGKITDIRGYPDRDDALTESAQRR